MNINVSEPSVILLMGASGSGKSSFARKHFLPSEIISSDYCRGLVSDDENSQQASKDAFEVLHFLLAKRLKNMRLTVIDATNTQVAGRKAVLDIAREYHLPVSAVILLPGEDVCQERNANRPDRQFGPHVVKRQTRELKGSIRGLRKEGIRNITILDTVRSIDEAVFNRRPLWNDRKTEHGPFDIIGDVHGCFSELRQLVATLGYTDDQTGIARHPEGRKLVFVGDLVDRGPDSVGVLRWVMAHVAAESAICVPGNHDDKLARCLGGANVTRSHGLAKTMEALNAESDEFRAAVEKFLIGLVGHYVFDDGKLVVAHAGMKEHYQGRASARIRDFALYGETTGESDEFGLPIRYPWAEDYRGNATVIYGHTPVLEAEWLNNTMCIDTGCVFGGKLTAFRYPERELVSVPAHQVYSEPIRPLAPARTTSLQLDNDDLLDIEDVSGRTYISSRLGGNSIIREENATAALEIMSRYAANPKWIVYLPPTMSPSETSRLPGYLEYPTEAFQYFKEQGIAEVMCEEKHMGSRAVVVICRNHEVALARFGVEGELGAILTRTGRRFFEDSSLEQGFLSRIIAAAERSSLFDELQSDWLVLDAELMPWSAKAQALLRQQYAPVASAAIQHYSAYHEALRTTEARLGLGNDLSENLAARLSKANDYRAAYRQYCWSVSSLDDYRLAPFHILAGEQGTYFDRDHRWHMNHLASLADHDAILMATRCMAVDLSDESSIQAATAWWLELTGNGGEGMVIKPMDFTVKAGRGIVQPALKCRGKEYLRIIYGPEYDFEDNLKNLRRRGLGRKRGLAQREFILGHEGLSRFVERQPLRNVHQCAFAVLALESEPVDPRL